MCIRDREKAAHNGKVVYSLDFEVTPQQLRHTYITNLIHASVDPKTVQYLAGDVYKRQVTGLSGKLAQKKKRALSDPCRKRLFFSVR